MGGPVSYSTASIHHVDHLRYDNVSTPSRGDPQLAGKPAHGISIHDEAASKCLCLPRSKQDTISLQKASRNVPAAHIVASLLADAEQISSTIKGTEPPRSLKGEGRGFCKPQESLRAVGN
jgi:hypothetical protein